MAEEKLSEEKQPVVAVKSEKQVEVKNEAKSNQKIAVILVRGLVNVKTTIKDTLKC